MKCADASDVVQCGHEYKCLSVTNSGFLTRVVGLGRQLIFGQSFPKYASKRKKTPNRRSAHPRRPHNQ